MRFNLPGGGPELGQAVERFLRQVLAFPLRLWRVATGDLPTASSDNAGGLAWNSTVSIITWSNGSAWVQPSLSTHVHAASAVTFAPAGNIAATNVQAAIEELDTEKQPLDATLTALAAYNTNGLLTQTAADTFTGRTLTAGSSKIAITNGNGVAGNPTVDLGTVAIGDITNLQTTLDGKQPLDSELTAIAGLTSVADRLPYFTGSGTAALATFTAAGRSMVAAADATAQRELLRNACMVKKAADQLAANYTAATIITFDAETYDDGGWHDNVTNNSRLTVPAGVTRVRVGCAIRIQNGTSGSLITLNLMKNGVGIFDGVVGEVTSAASTNARVNFASGPIPCVATDYFELQLTYATDTSIDILADRTNFWIEAC